MAIVKGAPFRYKGAIDVSDCKTAKEVIEKANLSWNVAKCELVAKMPAMLNNELGEDAFLYGGSVFRPAPNMYGTYRTDVNIPLGVVKGKYTPVQNIDAFNFFDNAIGVDKAIWQTAGWFGNGERIFVSAKLPNNILVNGDPVENYLVFTNSHDGSSGVKILFTPIRIICQNTLTAAIRQATNYVSFRHTQSVHGNLSIANELLGISTMMAKSCEENYIQFANHKMSDDEVKDYLVKSVLNPAEYSQLYKTGHNITQLINKDWRAINDSEISMRKVNVIHNMYEYYHIGPGQRSIQGTLWGAVNAITGYYSNVDNSEGTKRMDSLLYGDKARKIINAFELGNQRLSA